MCLSSPLGAGSTAANRRNASAISPAVHALMVRPAATAAMAALGGRRVRAVVLGPGALGRGSAGVLARAFARVLRGAAALRRGGARLRRVGFFTMLSV